MKGKLFLCVLACQRAIQVLGFAVTENSSTVSGKRSLHNDLRNGWIRVLGASSDGSISSASSDSIVNHKTYRVQIKYSAEKDWALRSFWIAQELLTTFAKQIELSALTLIPSTDEIYSVNLVSIDNDSGNLLGEAVLWKYGDREQKFPETKILKQIIRDRISPDLSLGHSDRDDRKSPDSSGITDTIIDFNQDIKEITTKPAVECLPSIQASTSQDDSATSAFKKHHVLILYCTGCRWMLRASYLAQEMQRRHRDLIVTLAPSRPPCRPGSFVVQLVGATDSDDVEGSNNTILWDRAVEKCFPDADALLEKVDSIIADGSDDESRDMFAFEELDDDDAAEARAFYGVM